jgi:hypothetical protein
MLSASDCAFAHVVFLALGQNGSWNLPGVTPKPAHQSTLAGTLSRFGEAPRNFQGVKVMSQNPVTGHTLRGISYDLLREAIKADGRNPYVVVYAEGEPAILWLAQEPTLEFAERLSVNATGVRQVLSIGLRSLAGLLNGARPVTSV